MSASRGRSRRDNHIRDEDDPSPSERDFPIAWRTRSRVRQLAIPPNQQPPIRSGGRRRPNRDRSQRHRSRSPIDRSRVSDNPPENVQGPPMGNQQRDRPEPEGIREPPVGNQREELPVCSICIEDIEEGVDATTLACSHIFHSDCITRWMQESRVCPNCRAPIPQEDMGLQPLLMEIPGYGPFLFMGPANLLGQQAVLNEYYVNGVRFIDIHLPPRQP